MPESYLRGVAGFIYGYLTKHNYRDAFYFGVSTGSASAFSDELATKDKAMELYDVIMHT